MPQTQDAPAPLDSPISKSSSQTTNTTTTRRPQISAERAADPVIAAQLAANEHHAHGCCNKRYHCDGSKCPNGRLMNPAIGIPLAVATGGLSAAAAGMYRGVRDHKSRKKLQEAINEERARQEKLEAEDEASRDLLTPSSTALPNGGSSAKELEGEGNAAMRLAEADGTSAGGSTHDGSLMKGTQTQDSQKSAAVTELDSTPVDASRKYAAELEGSSTGGGQVVSRDQSHKGSVAELDAGNNRHELA